MSNSTIPALAAQLLEEGTAVARAELRVVKARVGARIAAAKTAAILFAAAAILALLGLIGFVVGCVLALSRVMNPVLAGLVGLVVTLLIAAILGWIGARSLSAKPVTAPGKPS